MDIELKSIKIRDLVDGYMNDEEDGVSGYRGKLDIRPSFQREFVYKDKQRDAVINTVTKGFPLNVMYWVDDAQGGFEVLDGQQRTISICEYVEGTYSIDYRFFHNLEEDEKTAILDYELMVYFCKGTDTEKLDWFRTINIAGEKLTAQELRNAIYRGPWLSNAKKIFSKTGGVAHAIGGDYLKGTAIRQDYLETVIKWISSDNIESHMAEHQHKPSASKLRIYFEDVIGWVKTTFPNYRKEMKGVDFGLLYNHFKLRDIDPIALENEISILMQDEDVTKKSGIYAYVLTKDERSLSIRAFTNNQKREAYERQNGVCVKCLGTFDLNEMEADHITPWSEGGKTTADNCQMLCKSCNRIKSNK